MGVSAAGFACGRIGVGKEKSSCSPDDLYVAVVGLEVLRVCDLLGSGASLGSASSVNRDDSAGRNVASLMRALPWLRVCFVQQSFQRSGISLKKALL